MEIDFAYQLRFYLGLFERELVPWYRRLCLPGSRSFDVGAREGYVTLLLARLSSPGGRAVAFEFDETEYHRLLRNVAANPHLQPPPEASLSRVTERSDGAATVSLDDAAYERYFVPDFVKIDVEGSELKVLIGEGGSARWLPDESMLRLVRVLEVLGHWHVDSGRARSQRVNIDGVPVASSGARE